MGQQKRRGMTSARSHLVYWNLYAYSVPSVAHVHKRNHLYPMNDQIKIRIHVHKKIWMVQWYIVHHSFGSRTLQLVPLRPVLSSSSVPLVLFKNGSHGLLSHAMQWCGRWETVLFLVDIWCSFRRSFTQRPVWPMQTLADVSGIVHTALVVYLIYDVCLFRQTGVLLFLSGSWGTG